MASTLLDMFHENGTPKYDTSISISSGTKAYRYFGLLILLNIFNRGKLLVCSPISSNPDAYSLTWNAERKILTYIGEFKTTLIECFNSDARFIVITLSLHYIDSGHANYVFIDKGINLGKDGKEMIAIRLEPFGFCNTCKHYEPDILDEKLNEVLNRIAKEANKDFNVRLLGKEADISSHGPQKHELCEQRMMGKQIFINTGLCSSHAFVTLYSMFKLIIDGGIDISKKEGQELLQDISEIVTDEIIHSQFGNVEKYDVAINQAITEEINIMLLQIIELYSVGKMVLRSGDPSGKIIAKILEVQEQKRSVPGVADKSFSDEIFIAYFNHIITHAKITSEDKNSIFTIYGIDIAKLPELFPLSKKPVHTDTKRRRLSGRPDASGHKITMKKHRIVSKAKAKAKAKSKAKAKAKAKSKAKAKAKAKAKSKAKTKTKAKAKAKAKTKAKTKAKINKNNI